MIWSFFALSLRRMKIYCTLHVQNCTVWTPILVLRICFCQCLEYLGCHFMLPPTGRARAKNSVHTPHCALVCLICTYLHMQCENPIQNQGGGFFFGCAKKTPFLNVTAEVVKIWVLFFNALFDNCFCEVGLQNKFQNTNFRIYSYFYVV